MIRVRLTTDQFNGLAYNSVNYACGRSSYVVGIIIRIIRDNMKYLRYSTIDEILRSLEDKNYGAFRQGTYDYHYNDWRSLSGELLDTYNSDISSVADIVFTDKDNLRLFVLTSFRFSLYNPGLDKASDYRSIIDECSEYVNDSWYDVFSRDMDDAKLLGSDTSKYEGVVDYLLNVKNNLKDQAVS